MLRDPLAVKKNSGRPLVVQKFLQNPKKTPLEPLDLLATVGQSCVCVCECEFEGVCVCAWRRTTVRRCDVEVSEKTISVKNTYLSVLTSISQIFLSIYNKLLYHNKILHKLKFKHIFHAIITSH